MPVPRTTLFSGSSAICTGNLIFWLESFVQSPEQGAPTGQVKTAAIDIPGQFRRCRLQRFQDGLFYLENALIQGFGDLLVGNHDLLGDTCNQVAAIDRNIIGGIVEVFQRGADLDLDLFGRSFADQQASDSGEGLP